MDFDGQPQYSDPTFNVTFYKSTIFHKNNESYIENEPTPENWGEVFPYNQNLAMVTLWSLTGVEIIVIIYIIVRFKKTKILETEKE